ncbi:methyl-accepting chemotaxis protein [Rugamonas sp. DEMB1]|uniref:methyl-accepting chemotaxis protein n=1 Tax=Rugamonas sp. DEMB1 TaxID=3039386 RepID=UPI00244A4DAB|nr:methyl-accepting chemotaxis protein [Rugamonas sp. DEMB1]WGG50718.1 methyl-accepting chemotaxis protein [Rugamonas sp. DEMB1]
MNKLSFQQKLWVPLIASLICIFIIFVYGAVQTRDLRIEERSNDLSDVDDVALSVVKLYGEQAQSGALSKEEAQKRAREVIKSLRFGKDGYVSITSATGVALMNPFKPENDGKDLSDFKDAKGVYLYRNIAAAGASPSGAGFVHYHWTRPGGTEPVAKMSRVARYKPWGWDLVTGVYMDDIDDAFRASLLKSAGVLAGVFALLWLVVSAINRSLRHTIGGDPAYASEVALQIANGDLSTPVQTHKTDDSSILFGMKTMQAKLADTIGEIRRSADTIATASAEIATGNMDLSARTESQASSLEETAASMEELTSTVNQNAANAQQANQLVISAAQVAEKGGHVVSQVVQTMETINASATRIVDIISVIDGIAFQTNILALNAAVEAARAGEQGRGFAVVATEVRNLAHRSAAAAKEIKELIGASVDSIKAGSVLVAEAGTTMDQVVASVSRVTEIMGAITSASNEQSTGIGHVNQAITEMDSVTQQNAALVEEAAAAAGSMQDQAAMLAQLVTRFRLSAAEGRAPAVGAPRRPALSR